jgi:hypothetical protein
MTFQEVEVALGAPNTLFAALLRQETDPRHGARGSVQAPRHRPLKRG